MWSYLLYLALFNFSSIVAKKFKQYENQSYTIFLMSLCRIFIKSKKTKKKHSISHVEWCRLKVIEENETKICIGVQRTHEQPPVKMLIRKVNEKRVAHP
jgi:hypothetical protein